MGSIKLWILAAGFLATVAGTAYITRQVDNARYLKLELSYAQAQEKAVATAREEQKRLDNLATEAAKREAFTQAKEALTAKRRLQEIKRHVKNNSRCITYGLVRVLDAAVHGVLAERLALPPGKSDDACTTLTPSDLARAISDNYATARANAIQLDALIAVLRAMKP